jgi:ribonuclease HI
MSTEIYTDGGCVGNPGPGAWSYIVLHDGKRRQAAGAERATTNNRMELTAVIQALREAQRHPTWKSGAIDLYTDSQYVQLGISRWIHTWLRNGWRTADKKPVKNQDLWQALHGLTGALPIRWHWLQGHAGHPENEACDRMVREAIRALGP